MSLDRDELIYLISELKKVFVVKSEFENSEPGGVTRDEFNEFKNEIDSMINNLKFVSHEELQEVEDMLGGKSLKYVTQEEFDALSDEEKNDPNIEWNIIDAEDLSHEHENKDILDNITQENIDAWNNGSNIEIPDNIVTEEDLLTLQNEIDKIKKIVDKPPTYYKPTLSLSVLPMSIMMGEDTDIMIKPVFKQNDAGNVSNVIITRDGVIISENNVDALDGINDIVNIIDKESIEYSVEVFYEDGSVKNTTLGNPYPSGSIKAGSIVAKFNVNVCAPSFYGVVTEFDVSLLNTINNQSKNYTFTNIELNDERFVYMYPASFGEVTSIKDGNNFEYINSYTKTNVEYNNIDYLVYILTDPITITGFKQDFS